MWTSILVVGCLLLVARAMWNGWRKGGLNQLATLVSLAAAYLTAALVFRLGSASPSCRCRS